jgi:glycosyltransferase involved in cell wall biosynthesis
MNNSSEIVVSVCMITYNHELFICQAIEGVLMQQCQFSYELVIGEDYSTDSTRGICEEYSRKYKETIKLLPSERNLGMMPNFTRTLQACKGKYIALCEGDDYWTDPLKLQKQVDFLEKKPEYSLCFHNALEYFEDKAENPRPFACLNTGEYTGDDILLNWIVPTASVVFRKPPELSLKYQKKYIFGDTPLFLKISEYGKIWYINEIMSVYRRHKHGMAANSKPHEKIIAQLKYINMEFNGKYEKTINYLISKRYYGKFRKSYLNRSPKMVKYFFLSLYWDSSIFSNILRIKLKRKRRDI